MRKELIITSVISISLACNILLGVNLYFAYQGVAKSLEINKTNSQIVSLNTLFVQKVLKTQGEISVQDRLKLENAVYETKDPQIIDDWKNFLASKTEQEAQAGAMTLLITLTDKIIY